MRLREALTGTIVIGIAALAGAPAALGQGDVLVSNGSPPSPFAQNKQNEPALAVDAFHPSVLVAGSNDEIDLEACNAGDPTKCPFTPGVGVSGVYFSFDSGHTWRQPTYSGYSARRCLGPPETPCDPQTPQQGGRIGTLPNYYEHGLVSDGDPAIAFGPRRVAGGFSRTESRLYYVNLTSNFNDKKSQAFRGFEAIAVSYTDSPHRAAAGDKTAWSAPVIVSKQSSTTFSDKEQVWADNARTSHFYGYVYVCNASYRSQERGNALPEPIIVSRSTDGGNTWTSKQISAASLNNNNPGRDGCTVRTDSRGTVYVFYKGVDPQTKQTGELEARSFDGGMNFERPHIVVAAVSPGTLDPTILRPVMDGLAGARADLAAAPSIDIANGAPSGTDATNEIVMTWADGRLGLNREAGLLAYSTNGGRSFSQPIRFDKSFPDQSADRPYYTAPGISPNGRDLYIVYNAFQNRYRSTTSEPRSLQGIVLHADLGANGAPGPFQELHRGAAGDPRGSSQNNLVAEFLGDYVYAVATRTYGAGVWNDVRNAADCPAIDRYRQQVEDAVRAGTIPPIAAEDRPTDDAPPGSGGGTAPTRPAPNRDCPSRFGNSDIYGGSYPDPTP